MALSLLETYLPATGASCSARMERGPGGFGKGLLGWCEIWGLGLFLEEEEMESFSSSSSSERVEYALQRRSMAEREREMQENPKAEAT